MPPFISPHQIPPLPQLSTTTQQSSTQFQQHTVQFPQHQQPIQTQQFRVRPQREQHTVQFPQHQQPQVQQQREEQPAQFTQSQTMTPLQHSRKTYTKPIHKYNTKKPSQELPQKVQYHQHHKKPKYRDYSLPSLPSSKNDSFNDSFIPPKYEIPGEVAMTVAMNTVNTPVARRCMKPLRKKNSAYNQNVQKEEKLRTIEISNDYRLDITTGQEFDS